MPYLLPSGDAYTTQHWCYLVFVPAMEEYRRAFLGSILGLEVWNIWERNEAKSGTDAARAWKEANQLTMACMDGTMTCLDDILEELVLLRATLSQARDCCDQPYTYTYDDDINPPIIEPGTGDPPATWGDGEVITTWGDWNDYVCYWANAYVDSLLQMVDSLQSYSLLGTYSITAIAALLALGAALGLLIPVSFPLAAAVVAGLLLTGTSSIFVDARNDLENARDEIVCSILQNTGLGDAVEDALSSGLAWDLFFQFVGYNRALETMYTGEYNGEYLEALTDDTCVCADENEFDITFTFDSDLEVWTVSGVGATSWVAAGNPGGSIWGQAASGGQFNHWSLTDDALETALGVSGVQFRIYELHWENYIDVGATHGLRSWIDYPNNLRNVGFSGYPATSWEIEARTGLDILVANGGQVVRYEHYGTHISTWRNCWIDNIRIVGRYD